MQLISAQDGKLVRLQEQEHTAAAAPVGIVSGLDAFDALLPAGGLRLGAIHELLHRPDHPSPRWVAAHLSWHGRPAHATKRQDARYLVWFDPDLTLYPPALAAMGVDLARMLIIRPVSRAEMLWALAECLRCNAVRSVVCAMDEMSRVDARKLQLAAEQGGGIGWLLRPQTRHASIYAAATRWIVEPAVGERSLQRWKMQLLHGHGGRIGSAVYLEQRHDGQPQTHLLRATDALADRSSAAATTPARIAS